MANGALTGAGTGAAIGTAVYPGIGTAIGAVGGGLIGALGDQNSQNAQHVAVQGALGELDNAQGIVNNSAIAGTNLANTGYANAASLWDANGDLVTNYNSALNDLAGLQGYDAGVFNYDKSIEDFYDPAFQLSANMANDAINNSQATAGNMFSSDTANKLAAKNNVLATQMYDDARQAFNADKSLEQSIWAGNEAAKQAEATSNANLASARVGAYGNGMSNLSNAQQDYIKNLMDINSNYASDYVDIYGTKANLKANDPGEKSTMQTLLDPFGIFG